MMNMWALGVTNLAERQEFGQSARQGPVEQDVCPRPYRELGRKLPCLESLVMLKVVQRLEKVEHCPRWSVSDPGDTRRQAVR